MRITQDKDIVDVPVLEESLNKHVLIVLQRMNIDIAEIANRTRTFRVETSSVSDAYHVLSNCNPIRISSESNAVIVDLEDNKTPVEIAEYLKEKNVPVDRIDVVAESDKELRRTILEHRY